jgi:alkylation response protein AidB-like acyl-CoA dehydrogenase
MDWQYSQEDQLFREEVRTWLAENKPREIPPTENSDIRQFELAWQRKQFDGGWAGISWPAEYGGRGFSLVRQMIWFEEYAQADAPSLGCLVVAINHGGPTLMVRGSGDQKAFHLPRILKGEAVWCQGFSEPNAGSDLAGLKTRGEVDGDYIVVSGQKIWTTFGDIADYQELLVRTDPKAPKHKGISWVICDMHLPGIEVRPIRTMSGHQHFSQVFYNEVRIPVSNVVGDLNRGWEVAMSTLGFERGTGYIAHGVKLARSVESLIELARSVRGPDGRRPAIKDDELHCRLATARAEVAALRSMCYAAISRNERSEAPGPEGSIIALYFGELIQRIHRLALDILGPLAMTRDGDYGIWTNGYLENFRSSIAGGTSEIRRNIIGERVLGLPR